MKLTNGAIVRAAAGVRTLASLDLRDESGKPVDFPFKTQYRLGRMGDVLERAATLIEREKFRHAMAAAPSVDGRALTVEEQGAREEAALVYLDQERDDADVFLDSKWVTPITMKDLGVPASVLRGGARWVRDLGELFIDDTEGSA